MAYCRLCITHRTHVKICDFSEKDVWIRLRSHTILGLWPVGLAEIT